MDRTALPKFLAETRSVTAVEFAIIAPVLFLFLFGILLLGVVQFWQLTLDDAVRNAARQVIIGAGTGATTGVQSGSAFVTSVCSEFGLAAPNCAATLQYSVQSAVTFTGSSNGITPSAFSAAGQLAKSPTFSAVTRQPVLVQAAYAVPISIPLLSMSLVTLNGTPSIVSAAAMVAEP